MKKDSYSKQILGIFTFLKKRFKRQSVKVIFMRFTVPELTRRLIKFSLKLNINNNKCVNNNNQTEKLQL